MQFLHANAPAGGTLSLEGIAALHGAFQATTGTLANVLCVSSDGTRNYTHTLVLALRHPVSLAAAVWSCMFTCASRFRGWCWLQSVTRMSIAASLPALAPTTAEADDDETRPIRVGGGRSKVRDHAARRPAPSHFSVLTILVDELSRHGDMHLLL